MPKNKVHSDTEKSFLITAECRYSTSTSFHDNCASFPMGYLPWRLQVHLFLLAHLAHLRRSCAVQIWALLKP